ncbi:class B sortase [Ruminococcus sp. YRD2003]|uniref:class B sortase n=1 Tax=Ruminococcus sp. YRD2003 TaxID=1452313 RepID=UPI000943D372
MKSNAKLIAACGALVAAAGLTAASLFGCSEKEEHIVGKAEPVTQVSTESTTLPAYDYVPSETGMTERAKMLLKENKDIVGWIKIDQTKVDYPVVRDPGEIPEGVPYYGGEAYEVNSYYLEHGVDRQLHREGAMFMDFRDDFGSDEAEQSENIVIYGHNMANNTMLGSIRRYRQDYEFFNSAPFIELSSNYRDYDYVICCCAITSGHTYTDFGYWDMEELNDEETFNEYMTLARGRQLFDTGVDVKFGDKLLTLSTCYADEDNSRFIIIARRLREGEKSGSLDTIERTEEYKKAHAPTEPATEETTEAAQ